MKPRQRTVKTKPAKPKQPKATLPVQIVGGFFGRPVAGSTAQRAKRRAARQKSTITAAADGNYGEITLYGTIGQDFWGDGVSASQFKDTLDGLGEVESIRLLINSGGGDVFDATAIYNMLVKHPAPVTVEIEGVAASAATLIAMAGDEIHIAENAHFMIHAASGLAWGNAEQLKQYLKLLSNADKLIRLTYSTRTGIDDAELEDLMSFDNWMTADEAFELGFVDVVDEAKRVTPDVTPENAAPKQLAAIEPSRLETAASAIDELAAVFSTHLGLSTSRHISASATPSHQPTGTDPQPNSEKGILMSKKLRARCVAAGMPVELDDDKATEWLDEHFDEVFAASEPQPSDTDGDSLSADSIISIIDERERRQLQARREWRGETDALLSLGFDDDRQIPAGLREQCYDLQGETDGTAKVRELIQDAKAKQQELINSRVSIRMPQSQPRDRHVAALRAGLMVRCLRNAVTPGRVSLSPEQILEKHLPEADRPNGWQDFSRMPLVKLAEECLVADGFSDVQVRRLSAPQIAQAALGFHRQAGVRADAALHTTGSLAFITQDAINKSLLAGYEEAPQTWRGPGRQAESVSDFKDIHRIKLGAAANLSVWPDNLPPNKAKLSNEEEKYAVEARAETLSFSWRLILNDDLDALSRRPQLLGDAAARTVNAVFWQQITSNPKLADGQPLFLENPTGARKRSNFITGADTPTNASIGEMRKLMRLMRGLNTPEGNESDDILNLTPTFIVGPAALEETILKQVFSGADPSDNKSSAVYNTSRNLQPIIEPLLDADSAKAWYLFASPGRIDTVEVTFLMGQETPIAHQWMDDETMAQNFTIIQTFAAKAVDHRGMIKHKGE